MVETAPDSGTMRAMVLEATASELVPRTRPIPEPAPGQVLIQVEACAVCRTDLHVVDGELPDIPLPIVPGHEIVGTGLWAYHHWRSVIGSACRGWHRLASIVAIVNAARKIYVKPHVLPATRWTVATPSMCWPTQIMSCSSSMMSMRSPRRPCCVPD